MGFSKRKNYDLLKVVHPGRHVEFFRAPITAGQLMEKYPRHCIARPDVFEFPWIVVHPGSVLVPGKVFYLVPFHTMNILLKTKQQQQQQQQQRQQKLLVSSKQNQFLKHRQHDRCYERQSYNKSANDEVYKQEFYKCWNEMQKNLRNYYDQIDPCDKSSENNDLLKLRSCLRKPDSVRKKQKFMVTFASPVVIPCNR